MNIVNVVGTRPNFMKMAPIVAEMGRHTTIRQRLVHTGQHYDAAMSQLFFDELGMPPPDVYLGVGSGSHAAQTARVMLGFEPVLTEDRPDLVVVVGDVNSTLACALVAVKMGIRVAHVEAGLRSFDRDMPEEINRIVTDALCDLLLIPSADGRENLLREGIPEERIRFVGNVMIDSLRRHEEKARARPILREMRVVPRGYALLTLHRPSNVDRPETLASLIDVVETVQRRLPLIFPLHPRTRAMLEQHALGARLHAMPGVRLTDPLGYLDFLALMSQARAVLTDSGGIQEETTALGVPCLTLRVNTERPITVTQGTNRLVGQDPQHILDAFEEVMGETAVEQDAVEQADSLPAGVGNQANSLPHRIPDLWDGKAAERIVAVCLEGVGH
jgi:UDP-N-acetylglucosamine 2-epimerase (non-hydrolysing)